MQWLVHACFCLAEAVNQTSIFSDVVGSRCMIVGHARHSHDASCVRREVIVGNDRSRTFLSGLPRAPLSKKNRFRPWAGMLSCGRVLAHVEDESLPDECALRSKKLSPSCDGAARSKWHEASMQLRNATACAQPETLRNEILPDLRAAQKRQTSLIASQAALG
ncbi:unnamed protein product [Peronospora belbahrii]|uniref:Secreted protein n=1 Tax=Peronospora belbahrii TaxID=622444 RepID=A0ABN8CMH9_9STRA|nr:unnamed protein product [Peronospora belbahrii]